MLVARLAQDHSHDRILALLPPLLVRADGILDPYASDYIAINADEIASQQAFLVDVAHSVANRMGSRRAHNLNGERRSRAVPLACFDIRLDLLCVVATADVNLLDASVGQELECVLDERRVR
jgi:hypothetical protein